MLAVSVRANNQPERGVSADVRNHNPIVQTAQPKDTQQVPCLIYVIVCGEYRLLPVVGFGNSCDMIAIAVQTFIDHNTNCN